MKKTLSLILAAVCAASALASCASHSSLLTPHSSLLTSTSSDYADESWLKSRIGTIPDNVTVGTSDSLGINMDDFEDDGYIIRTTDENTVLCGKTAEGLDAAVRSYARSVKYGYAVADTTYHEGYRIEKLTVAGRNISEYTAVYTKGDEPTMPDVGLTRGNAEYAAREFVRLIKEATGVTLAITGDDVPYDTPCVFFEAFDDDTYDFRGGYSYEVRDGNVYFKGNGTNAGCSNGVYYFLEHLCGWEGLTYGDSCLREAEHIDIPEGTKREGHLTFSYYIQGNLYTDHIKTDRDISHRGMWVHCCHGIQNGKLLGDDFDYVWHQPCYLSDETFEITVECVEAQIKSSIAAGKVVGETLTYIDLGFPDNEDWCNCKDCRACLKENGSIAGAVIRYTNKVAETIDSEYPGMRYLNFAYLQTKIPPKVDLPSDLLKITFCLDGVCNTHPIGSDDCTEATPRSAKLFGSAIRNIDYAEWIREWGSISNDLDVWYYTMDAAFAQYNVTDYVMFEDAKFLSSVGVAGIYLDGECCGLGLGRMNHVMMPVIQWEPDITYEEYIAAIEEKVTLSYGAGSYEAFKAVADVLRQSKLREGCDGGWHTEEFNFTDVDYKYIGENLDRVAALVEDMIEDAPTALAEMRAKEFSLALYYEGIAGAYFPAFYAGDSERIAELSDMYAVFLERSEECGFPPSAYPLGIGRPTRALGATLAEEAEYWKKCSGAPQK